MIAYLSGRLEEAGENTIIVECGGIGYEIRVPLSVFQGLPAPGTEVKIYTFLQVREDDIGLFGFLTKDELELFKLLIRVNGIGPKGALGILSTISPDELRMAVFSGDAKTIARSPGVGPKTAGRLILELKDKLTLPHAASEEALSGVPAAEGLAGSRADAAAALTALGYSETEAFQAVRQVELSEDMDTEDILRQSLKIISRL